MQGNCSLIVTEPRRVETEVIQCHRDPFSVVQTPSQGQRSYVVLPRDGVFANTAEEIAKRVVRIGTRQRLRAAGIGTSEGALEPLSSLDESTPSQPVAPQRTRALQRGLRRPVFKRPGEGGVDIRL